MSTPPPPCSLILPLPADLHQWYLCRHVLDSYSQLAASPTPPSWLPAVETSGEVPFIASFHVKTFILTVLEGSPVLQTIVWSRSTWELCSAWPLECGRPDYHCEWRKKCFSSLICCYLWNAEDLTAIVSEENGIFLLWCVVFFVKVRDYGMVVVSREGSNPEKFIYNSDLLTKYRYFLF